MSAITDNLTAHEVRWLQRTMDTEVSLYARRVLRTLLDSIDPLPESPISNVFNFTTPALTWSVNHQMHRRPNALVLAADGHAIEGDEAWPDADHFSVTFSTPQTGMVILS